jgi:hypothetical protein
MLLLLLLMLLRHMLYRSTMQQLLMFQLPFLLVLLKQLLPPLLLAPDPGALLIVYLCSLATATATAPPTTAAAAPTTAGALRWHQRSVMIISWAMSDMHPASDHSFVPHSPARLEHFHLFHLNVTAPNLPTMSGTGTEVDVNDPPQHLSRRLDLHSFAKGLVLLRPPHICLECLRALRVHRIRLPGPAVAPVYTSQQGLTLVHCSTRLKRFREIRWVIPVTRTA